MKILVLIMFLLPVQIPDAMVMEYDLITGAMEGVYLTIPGVCETEVVDSSEIAAIRLYEKQQGDKQYQAALYELTLPEGTFEEVPIPEIAFSPPESGPFTGTVTTLGLGVTTLHEWTPSGGVPERRNR